MRLACPAPDNPAAAEQQNKMLIEALGLVSYGIHSDDDGEVTGFTSKQRLDDMIDKFHGKKTYISRKRPEIEYNKEEEPAGTKRIKHISTNEEFSSTVLNGPYAKKLKYREYFELSDEISELLNTCWLSNPQLKYFATKLMGGAIMYNTETHEGLLVTTVEVYGRTASLDPHHEASNVSLPPKETKYPNVFPITNKTADGNKLLIGTKQLNYLITGSVRVDSFHMPEVGPSTNRFDVGSDECSKNISIFLDKNVYEQAKSLGENVDCDCVETSHTLYQLRQIRSKFNEIETFYRIRATTDMLNVIHCQPLSIFTLCNHLKALDSNTEDDSANYKLASQLFMKIASAVILKNYKARLHKDVVESIFLKFKKPSQRIPTIVKEILDLYEDESEEIRVISNIALNRKLVSLADLLAPQINKSNSDIINNIHASITKTG